MIRNQAYRQIHKNLTSRYPKESTDRKSDLHHLLSLSGSFCIFSDYRNGITTLMKEFAREVNGIFVDSMCLNSGLEITTLDSIVGSSSNPLLLDETKSFFSRLNSYETGMNYLQKQSEKRQVGLRLHLESNLYKDDLRKRGFEIVDIGKISYEEFEVIFDSQFEGTGFSLPKRFIQYAHINYDVLTKSILYVAEAFRLLIENPDAIISETEVQKSVDFGIE